MAASFTSKDCYTKKIHYSSSHADGVAGEGHAYHGLFTMMLLIYNKGVSYDKKLNVGPTESDRHRASALQTMVGCSAHLVWIVDEFEFGAVLRVLQVHRLAGARCRSRRVRGRRVQQRPNLGRVQCERLAAEHTGDVGWRQILECVVSDIRYHEVPATRPGRDVEQTR